MATSIATGVAGQIILVASGIISARVLGPENRGHLALLFALSALTTHLGSLGVPLSTTYWIASKGVATRTLIQSLGRFRRLQLGIALTVQAVLVGLILVPRIPPGLVWMGLLSLLATAAGLPQMYGLAILQGMGRFGSFNLLRTLAGALYTVGVVAMWAVGHATLATIGVVFALASILAAIATWATLLRMIPPNETDRVTVRPLVSFGVRSLFGSASPVETYRLDQLLVGVTLAPVALGYYVVALAFTNLARFVGQSIGMITYPNIAGAKNKAAQLRLLRHDVALGAIACGIVTLSLIVVSPNLIELFFGPDFASAVPVAQILLLATFFAAVRRILIDGTRGSGRPIWGTAVEAITLLALPLAAIIGQRTDSVSAVAAVIASVNLVALAAIAPALLGVGFRETQGIVSQEPSPHSDLTPHTPPFEGWWLWRKKISRRA